MRPSPAFAIIASFLWWCAGAQSSRALTLAEGLDTPDVAWVSVASDPWFARATTDAHDGQDLVEVSPFINHDAVPRLTATLTGPAVFRFRWRFLSASTDPALFVEVDGASAMIPVRETESEGWMPVEVQLSPGPHTVSFYPTVDTRLQLDEGSLVNESGSLAPAGDPSLSWIIPYGAAWGPGRDTPPGGTLAVAWQSGGPWPLVYCLFPPNSKIEGWFKSTAASGTFFLSSESRYFYYPARGGSPRWQRFRAVAPAQWISFTAQGFENGEISPVDLQLAGLTATPAGPGDILDAPELSWSTSGSPSFTLDGEDPGEHHTSSLAVWGTDPFTASLHTSVTGPGRLFFSALTYLDPSARREVALNGTVVSEVSKSTGRWERNSVSVPPGQVSVEFRAINGVEEGEEGNLSYFVFDDVTMCVSAGAAQKDALDLPAAAELWMRQSGAGAWSRSTNISHDGTDSLTLAASSAPRRADLILPTDDAPLTGMWIKTDPDTELKIQPLTSLPNHLVKTFFPVPGSDWNWVPIHPGLCSELRMAVIPASDKGAALHLDGYATYSTQVPTAEAIESTERTWEGPAGLALPGSDATGEKAVLLTHSGISTSIDTPVRIKFRYRFCVTMGESVAAVTIGPDVVSVLRPEADATQAWKEKEVFSFNSADDQFLTFICGDGPLLLDKVEIFPLANASIPDALDTPDLTVPQPASWKGIAGIGHDGTDAVISPPISFGTLGNTELVAYTPLTGSLDGSFWWKREFTFGQLRFRTLENPLAPGVALYSGAGWQQVRLHCDRPSSGLRWTLAPASGNSWNDTVPAGDVQLDELQLLPGVQDSFSNALDTDLPGPGAALTGWDAVGQAVASVQTTDTWQGGDALQLRAVPGGPPVQTVTLSARFNAGTAFSCRVKRGPLSGVSLTLMTGNQPWADIPLTTEWTEFKTLLPIAYAEGEGWIALKAQVPDAGPNASIYLDAVSLTPATDFNAALETTGLTWTATGQGREVIGGDLVPESALIIPSYSGLVDGVTFKDLAAGQRRRLDTVMTGPGIAVFTGYRAASDAGQWQTSLLVDGVAVDALPSVITGVFYLQAFIPAGAHSVRWLLEHLPGGIEVPGGLRLHSVAFVPGLPADLLPAALESIAPGQAWLPGGSRSPLPLYTLKEGVTALHGIFFPGSPPGESSWMETSVTGPARVRFSWQSAAIAACYLDGQTACRTFPEPRNLTTFRDPLTTMHVPAGPHTLRWANSQGISAELRAFSVTPGSDIVSVLGNASPPIIWLHEPEMPTYPGWQVITDDDLTWFWEDGSSVSVPGTGLPVLGGADVTMGSFWVNGPAVVSFDVRRHKWTAFLVRVDDIEWYTGLTFEESPEEFRWKPNAVVVPTGQHLVSLISPEGNFMTDPYYRLKNIRIEPGLPWLTWVYGIGLIDISENSPYADPDEDGVNNLMEFAFGTQPRSFNFSGPAGPQITGPPDQPRLQFPALPWDATSLTYDVESSSDMISWSSFTTLHPNPPGHPGPSLLLPSPLEGRKFYRVTVRL